MVNQAPQMSPLIPPHQQHSQSQPHPPPHPPQQQPVLELEDIHLPASPAFWPPAPGWWIAATLLIALVGFAFYKLLKYRNKRKQQQKILNVLSSFEQDLKEGKGSESIANINRLLRRLALMHYPRQQVASLTGSQWLGFLDTTGATTAFTKGAGRILEDGPYVAQLPENFDSFDSEGLIKAVTQWVKKINTQGTQTNKQGAK